MPKVNRERGAAAVEFAILLPLLAMLMVAIMEFGYAFFLQASVASAARVGVRSYAINWNDPAKGPTSVATATSLAKAALPTTSAPVTSVTVTPCQTANQTTMTLVYKYRSLTGMIDGLLGDISLTGKGSMECT